MEEVQKLKEMGCHRGMVSMQGLGYKEILAYLDGECHSGGSGIYLIKRDTRHFAKRQLTWFQARTGCASGFINRIIRIRKKRFYRICWTIHCNDK